MANAYKYQDNPQALIEKLYAKGLINGNGNGFVQKLINDSITLRSNAYFWQENFSLEGGEYQIDLGATKKNPAWTVREKTNRPVPTADAMAPLSEVAQLDGEGYIERTGSIWQFGKGLYETSMSKLELQARLQELGSVDGDLLDGYVRGVADLVKTHMYTLSHFSAQAISMGGYYDNTKIKGFSAIRVQQPAYVPTANFKKAGAKAWTDPTCDLPEQMRKIEADFREANNIDSNVQFVWQIPYDMIRSVFLTNQKMKDEVNRYIRNYAPDKVVVITSGGTSMDADTITIDQLVGYSRTADISKISPIMIVQESQVVQDIKTVRTVNGWDTGKAVLRPLGSDGKCGVIVHSTVADVEILGTGEVNNLVSVNSTKMLNFLYVLNAVSPDGMYKKYITKVIGRYAPVLNEATMHVVVDTTEADS
jgi:hypothetical protein